MAKKNNQETTDSFNVDDIDFDQVESDLYSLEDIDFDQVESDLETSEPGKKKVQEDPTQSSSLDGSLQQDEIDFNKPYDEVLSSLGSKPTELDYSKYPDASGDRRRLMEGEAAAKDLAKYLESNFHQSQVKAQKEKLTEEVKDIDFLSIPESEISDYAEERDLDAYDALSSLDLEDVIRKEKNTLIKKLEQDTRKASRLEYSERFNSANPDFTPQEVEAMIDSTEASDITKFGVDRLGLDDDQKTEYKESITDLVKLKNKKNKTTEENLELVALEEKVSKLREQPDKQFINPETGEIDNAVKKEVTDKAKVYTKEFKSDYTKFMDRYKSEYHRIQGLEKELKSRLDTDEIPSKFVYDTDEYYSQSPYTKYASLPPEAAKIAIKKSEANKGTIETLYEELQKSDKNFMALNRALLLNSDPASVSRGFELLEGIPVLSSLGKTATSMGESLFETITGDDVVTDRDYTQAIVDVANQEGVKLTEEQYDRGKAEFSEKLGDAIGVSLPIMGDIAFNTIIAKNASAWLNAPKYLARIKSLQNSPRLAKAVGQISESITQGIAFEMAEGGSYAMGTGEYFGGKFGEKMVSAITKGKGGKALALVGKILGGTVAGDVEEYAGEFVEEGFKNGWFTKEQFKNTFGRDYDEALDKFLLTSVMVTAMGGGAEVGSFLADSKKYYENLGDTQRATQLEELIKSTKEADTISKKAEAGDKTAIEGIQETKKELKNILSSEVTPEETTETTEEEVDPEETPEIVAEEEEEEVLTPKDDYAEDLEDDFDPAETEEEIAQLNKTQESVKSKLMDLGVSEQAATEIVQEANSSEELKSDFEKINKETDKALVEANKEIEAGKLAPGEEAGAEIIQDKLDKASRKYLREKKKAQAIVNKATNKVGKKITKTEIRKATDARMDTSPDANLTEKQVTNLLLRNEAKQNKKLKSAEKKTLSEVFKKVKSLAAERAGTEKGRLKGKIPTSKIQSLMKEAVALDVSDIDKVAALEHRIDQLAQDAEFDVKKQKAKNIQKQLGKAGKKRKGVRGDFAEQLKAIDLNAIKSMDVFTDLAKPLTGSFKATAETESDIVTQLEKGIKTLQEEQAKYEEQKGEKKEARDIANMEEEYSISGMDADMSFEEYRDFVNDIKTKDSKQKADELAADKSEKGTKKEQALRNLLPKRIDNLKSWLKNNKSNLSKNQQRAINDIINNKDLIADRDTTNLENLVDTFNALEEILSFDSTAGITRIASKLEGKQKANEIKRKYEGSFKGWGLYNALNQSTFFKAISKDMETAKGISQILTSDLQRSKNKVTKLSDTYNTKVDQAAKKYDIDEKSSVKVGVVSWFKQHNTGSTQEEITNDFDQKMKSLENQIKELQRPGSKTSIEIARDKRKSKALEEVYSDIEGAENKSDIERILSDNEKEFLSRVEKSFAEVKPELQESYLNNKGMALQEVENYVPTVVSKRQNYSKASDDLSDPFIQSKIDQEPSGRTIKRAKVDPTGRTVYNYDIVETAKFGMKETLSDVHSLYDKQVVANTVNDKSFKEAIDSNKIYASLKDKLGKTYGSNTYARDRTEANKFLRRVEGYYRGMMVMPLKTLSQYFKQPISIMAATGVKANPKASIDAYASMFNSIVSSEVSSNLDKLFSNSSVSIRTLAGDKELSETDPAYIQLMSKFSKLDKLTDVTKTYISDALVFSDTAAARGSFLSFYISERMKQEGKGYKFDLAKEAANPNMEAIGKADVETDWVNNNSDQDQTASLLQSSDSVQKMLKNMFFLFKSFSINQSMNTILNARNIVSSNRSGKAEAGRELAGAVMGAVMFSLVKNAVREIHDVILTNTLSDIEDDNEEREYTEIFKDSAVDGLTDVILGGAPDRFINMIKSGINAAAWEAVQDENEIREDLGEEKLKKQDVAPYYISDNPPGILGLFSSYEESAYDAIDVIQDDYSTDEMERVATLNLLSMLLQEENARRLSGKAVREYKKINKKAKEDEN